jgi:hypothetical protein
MLTIAATIVIAPARVQNSRLSSQEYMPELARLT